MTDPCVFCEIIVGNEPADIVWEWPSVLMITPLNPVTPGHLLVIPKKHVKDFTDDPVESGFAMVCAAEYAMDLEEDMNLITSKGKNATQSVFHLHIHLVPRRKDDGLALPWYSGKGNHGSRTD